MIRLAVALTLFAAACGGAPARPQAPKDRVAIEWLPSPVARGGVTGVVRDRTGEPVVGATVVLGAHHRRDEIAVTGDGGAFQLDDVPPGQRTLTIYFADSTFQLGVVDLRADRAVQLFATVTIPPDSGVIVERCRDIGDCEPTVNMMSAEQGITLEHAQLDKLP